jgi:hypothetical protein
MIKDILEILKLDDWYGESEYIDIAKGKFKHTLSFKEIYKQKKREVLLKKKIKHG